MAALYNRISPLSAFLRSRLVATNVCLLKPGLGNNLCPVTCLHFEAENLSLSLFFVDRLPKPDCSSTKITVFQDLVYDFVDAKGMDIFKTPDGIIIENELQELWITLTPDSIAENSEQQNDCISTMWRLFGCLELQCVKTTRKAKK